MIAGRIIQIAEVGLRVTNLQQMIAFYQNVLGFEVEMAHPNHAFLKVGELKSPLGEIGHALILGLFDRQTELDDKSSTLDHLAFEIPSEYYEEELERFTSKGMVIRERSWPDTLDWRARSFFFYDPEGNVIEIIASNPT
jgi:catechol 2,3-dioxygenase-like lactoylglutathione lyase family enzyme